MSSEKSLHRQPRNVEAERRCCEIRLRAERNAGEILRQMEATRTGNQYTGRLPAEEGTNPTPKLGDLGIRHDQSSDGRDWPMSRWSNLRLR
jgi:hypothetical protein